MRNNKNVYFSNNCITDAIIVLLGAVVLTQFYVMLFEGLFTAHLFSEKLAGIMKFSGSLTNQFISLLSANSAIVAPLFGIVMLSAAVLLILLIGRSIIANITGIGFLLGWILLWNYPGMWTFELLFPALFGIFVGLSKVGHPFYGLSLYHQLSLSKISRVFVILLLSCFLGYVTFYAGIHSISPYKPAISAALTFMILSYIHLKLNRY